MSHWTLAQPASTRTTNPHGELDKNPGVNQAIAAVDGAAPTPPGTARTFSRFTARTAPSTLRLRFSYALALCGDNGRTIDDVREAVTTLAETERIARRGLGGTHPLTVDIEHVLQKARAALRARETPSLGGSA